MRIRVSAILDGASGYANFARGLLAALHEAGVAVDVYPIPRMLHPLYLAYFRRTLQRGCDQLPQPDVNIITATPDRLLQYRLRGAVNLGFTMFEASRLPRNWVDIMNQLDGILVPCDWNREVFQTSGVHVPIHVVPPGLHLPSVEEGSEPGCGSIIDRTLGPYRSAYKFYSIFQWRERKNPDGLLRAYFAEFKPADNVCLVLKTYYSNFRNKLLPRHERRRMERMVQAVRRSMNLRHFPPVKLIVGYLSGREVADIHRRCDCFVLPHRAEGWGLPHMAAMGHAKPVITTGYSGNMDFMSADTARLLPYQLTPVVNMEQACYEGDMLWAEPDLGALRQAMRQFYENPVQARQLGTRARQHLAQNFSWTTQIDRWIVTLKSFRDRQGGQPLTARAENAGQAALVEIC